MIETPDAQPTPITGAWIKQVRLGYGLTQAELGALLGGIAHESISRIESGLRMLPRDAGCQLIFRALAHQWEKGIGDPAQFVALLRGLPWPSAVAMLIARTPPCYLGDMDLPALGMWRPVGGPAPSHGTHPPVFEAPPAFERPADRIVDRTQEWE